MFVEVLTDFPERLKPGLVLYLGTEADQLRLTSCRRHGKGLLMTFEGYTTPEQVSQFRNQIIYVRSVDRPPLADGEYYHHQLISLHVITAEGVSIGTVTGILVTGASDVLVIQSETGPEVLIPVAGPFIQSIDLARREITVHLIPGMLEEA
jgi:16S rRNA processing protein RimM